MANVEDIVVLIVEDDAILRARYRDAVLAAGYTAKALDSATVVTRLGENEAQVDVAVIDLNMPSMTGLQIARTLRSLSPETRIVLLIRNRLVARAGPALAPEADAYLTKPVDPPDLVRCVERLIEAAEIEQNSRRYRALAALNDISSIAVEAVSLDHFADTLLWLLKDAFLADRISLMLAGEDRTMSLMASLGLPGEVKPGLKVSVDDSIAGQALSQRQSLLLNGPQPHSRSAQPIQSALIVPLQYGDECSGVLNLSRVRRNAPFTDGDLCLVETLARPVAAALQAFSRLSERTKPPEGKDAFLGAVPTFEELWEAGLNLALRDLGAEVLVLAAPDGEVWSASVTANVDRQHRVAEQAARQLGFEPPHLVRPVCIGHSPAAEKEVTVVALSLETESGFAWIGGTFSAEREPAAQCAELERWGRLLADTALLVQPRPLLPEVLGSLLRPSRVGHRVPRWLEETKAPVAALAGRLARAVGLSEEARRGLKWGVLLAAAVPWPVGKVPVDLETGRVSLKNLADFDAFRAGGEAQWAVLETAATAWVLARETWDGRGPYGLKGTRIPLVAHIAAIAWYADRLLSTRWYRPALGPAEVVEVLRAGAGMRWDPDLVEVFAGCLLEGLQPAC